MQIITNSPNPHISIHKDVEGRIDRPVIKLDLKNKEFVVGGTGAGSQMETLPMMLNRLFGTKIKIISGYKGGNDVYLAMERGEVQGYCGSHDSVMGSDIARSGKIAILFQARMEEKRRAARTEARDAAQRILRERPDVAQRLGVSRTPIREALYRLGQEGFIQVVVHRQQRQGGHAGSSGDGHIQAAMKAHFLSLFNNF